MVYPRSATVSTQAHDKIIVSALENAVQLPPAGVTPPPMKKRRRDGTEAPKKRRRGEQSGLCRLNLDELYIVFAYIYPMDLLNLARTCKSLRGLLMHRSSAFLWRTALLRVEKLPGCPTDLAEPEYTSLVFYNRCHGCDKPAKVVLWNIRRRYCPACRVERLRHLRLCDEVIRWNNVLPYERLTIGEESGLWVDSDQVVSFMREYRWSPDKIRFLDQKREQRNTICSHARECESWQQQKGRIHRFDLELLRKERQTSIFERLTELGYGPELACQCFRSKLIGKCNKSISKKYKPLTCSEWDRIWPEWAEIMNSLRSQRLEKYVYPARQRILLNNYFEYVTNPSPDSLTFDLLPHVTDLARFPLFKDIINIPEAPQPNDKLFESAFAQLPVLVDEWTKKLNSEIAQLVKIPSHLSSSVVSGNRDRASGSTAESSQTDLDKLRLACAVFRVGGTGAFAHPEVLSVAMCNEVMFPSPQIHLCGVGITPGLQFLEEAPYIIHACGLDPNVATAPDMDRRNARLRCLACEGRILVMNWRHAIWHARFYHCIDIGLVPLSESPRWQLVSDEYIDAIEAVEKSVQKSFSPDWTRCLLCRPSVGDAVLYIHAVRHLAQCHYLQKDEIEEGVHYKLIGIRDVCVVEMIQIGEQARFKVLQE